MSTPSDSSIKILHEWTVTIDKEVSETADEVVNGQTVQVTRKMRKPAQTRMALRELKRPEKRSADLFRAGRIKHYVVDHGLLLASELTNRLINTTGGVLTDTEKKRVEELRERHVQLDHDIVRATDPAERKRLQGEQATIRTELLTLNALNEELFRDTADAKAALDLNNWLTFQMVVIERDGRWTPYFEGEGANPQETFAKREAFMWGLEDAKDEFYLAALDKITRYVYWYSRGADSPEAFKLMDEEMEKQRVAREEEAKRAKEAQAAKDAAEKAAGDVVPLDVGDEATSALVPAAA